MWRMFANIYLYLPLTTSNGIQTTMLLRTMNSDFSQKSIYNAVCEECLHISLYIYPYFPQLVKNDMLLTNDKFRFQPEIICNAVWRMFANIYLYVTPYFFKWCHTTCCWRMINSYSSEKSFVMLYVKNVYKYLFICYHLFSQLVKNDILLSMINSDFSQKWFVMLYVKNVCKYPFIFPTLFSQML